MGQTLVSLLQDRAAFDGDRAALHIRTPESQRAWSWAEVDDLVARWSAGLLSLGVRPGDRVVLLSENRWEWIACDLALQQLAAVSVPAHTGSSAEQIAEQVRHSGAGWAVVSNRQQADKLRRCRSLLPADLRCVGLDADCGPFDDRDIAALAALVPAQLSDPERRELRDLVTRHVTPDTLVSLLYTSGTTAQPKAAMLTHANLAFNAQATYRGTGESAGDLKLCVLPLSHIFARTCDVFIWLACGNRLALAGSRETWLQDLADVRPTWVNAVPYFYDRLRRLAEPTGGGRPDRLRELFGGRIRSCQCGGAAVSQATFDYYWQQGVPLFPGYGLTESSPVISVWGPDEATWDLVGRPIPGIEVRLAADGEILTRGPHVMAGYWRDADATREAIRGGWLHTGDLGVWDDGRLGVRGRKKELIVTTGGKKIVPSLLEMLLGQDPLILQAFVTGDGRDYPVALIVPDRDQLAKEADLANAACGSDNGLQVEAALRQLFQRRIEQRLAGLSRHEQIRRFALLPRPFSLEAGELTAKSSLRRDVILRNWAEEIEALYRQ